MEFLELVLKVIVYIFLLKSSAKTCNLKGLSSLDLLPFSSIMIKSPIHKSCYIHLLCRFLRIPIYTYTNEFQLYCHWGMLIVICLQWFLKFKLYHDKNELHSMRRLDLHIFFSASSTEPVCGLTCSTLLS